MTKRYKVTTTIEVLDDPDRYINPESGKVEVHTRSVVVGRSGSYDATIPKQIVPPWREVAKFGSGEGVDATSFVGAMPQLLVKINAAYAEVAKFAPLVDQAPAASTPAEQAQ